MKYESKSLLLSKVVFLSTPTNVATFMLEMSHSISGFVSLYLFFNAPLINDIASYIVRLSKLI